MGAYTYGKLRGRIIEKYRSVRKFCAAEGYAYENFIRRLNGKTNFSKAEMFELAGKLDIAGAELQEFFLP